MSKLRLIFRNLKDLLNEIYDFSCLLPIAPEQLYCSFALRFDSVCGLDFFEIGGSFLRHEHKKCTVGGIILKIPLKNYGKLKKTQFVFFVGVKIGLVFEKLR